MDFVALCTPQMFRILSSPGSTPKSPGISSSGDGNSNPPPLALPPNPQGFFKLRVGNLSVVLIAAENTEAVIWAMGHLHNKFPGT